MVSCVECGKRLGFFRYYHPTLGKKSVVCGSCLLKVEESVAQWRDFVQSNSFNPESTEFMMNANRGFQLNKVVGVHKQLTTFGLKKQFSKW